MAKKRADILAVEQGLAESRARAQALILAGAILTSDQQRVDKPGQQLDAATVLERKGEPLPYVSRGGLKLAGALDAFGVDPAGKVCLDVGASTGGFTDCLLQRGASRVFAVDVGYGQLAWKLRQDDRVVVIERANIRHLERSQVDAPCELVVIDVSFISLRKVVPAAMRFVADAGELVCLVKPQFEVGKADVGKGGIVRDAAARERALAEVVAALAGLGLDPPRTIDSPILGAKGNHEYLLATAWARAPAPKA